MAVTVKHAAMGTKLRSMQGKMLTESDYDRLLKMSTVSAAAHYLKEFESLGIILSGINDKEAHRGDLEKRLGTQMILEF
ncbi:MAG: V-type ATPase subunit [Clostridiales bacterium]|nr:MAG: V-type ATPase subunit [Clostridiales bacterium]